jgi:hypothetical protein
VFGDVFRSDTDVGSVYVLQCAASERANEVQIRLVLQRFFTENQVTPEQGSSDAIFGPANHAGDYEPFSVG